jgi:predicted hydrolase (HD superfamily)
VNRIEALHQKIDAILLPVGDPGWRRKFYVHLYGVASFAALLAEKRGIDPELATAAGLLHDLSAVTAGNYDNHCVLSADMARELLGDMPDFSDGEISLIHTAILRHDDRHLVHTPFDEILKDADILAPHCLDVTKPAGENARERLAAMKAELGL